MGGLCKECEQPYTDDNWCRSCNAKRFQQDFKNWTSGNPNIDKLIQESQINAKNGYEKLEWVEYDKFENIEYITKGGFGTIYKSRWKEGYIKYWYYRLNQWFRRGNTSVALKSLNNSKDITLEFLNEIKLHLKMNNSSSMIKLYGITKDSKTSNFVMVMQYAEDGNFRQVLNRDFKSFSFVDKLTALHEISSGLRDIHREGLTHQDFHIGNILTSSTAFCRITDLGLNADPSKRPTAQNLNFRCIEWFLESKNMRRGIREICKQFKEADEFNKNQPSFTKSDNNKLIYTTHPQAIYTSRLLNFNNLPEPKNEEYSESLKIDFTKLNIK
ncbi:kinase-like domain-containing protein [Glomus cerebriforme]|uniref:Kinase-like domain-containing protein n=1 Tax=Glomus cerebriforme TaxID=658196 RepID=A0A397SR29_9GLOM|nr:kinase-like domain-containing protein [Glomus cerebriforme]